MNEPNGFNAFWAAYPRRVGKGAAVKTWIKLKPSAAVQQQIADALEWQVHQQSWTEQGGKFIPYPATYLNRWQWEDEAPKRPTYEFDCQHDPRCAGRNACHIKQQIASLRP